MNTGCQVQDQLITSEPTEPYIIDRELNLRKLPSRQWEFELTTFRTAATDIDKD